MAGCSNRRDVQDAPEVVIINKAMAVTFGRTKMPSAVECVRRAKTWFTVIALWTT